MGKSRTDLPNNTAKFFYKLCVISYYTGQPNCWINDLCIPKKFAVPYRLYSYIMSVVIYGFILSEWASLYTQKNLTEKQQSDLMVYIMSHPMLWSYSVSFCSKVDQVKEILADILELKQIYNDTAVEKQMIKKSIIYSLVFVGMCGFSMLMFTSDAIMQVAMKDGTFTTVITAWPAVDDKSVSANVVRFLINVVWWSMLSRAMSVYSFVLGFTSCMSHQFINLQSYFQSLNNIFIDNRLSQLQKEVKYEAAYTIGIKLHWKTLECVSKCQTICRWLFDGQIIFNTIMLVLLMSQLLNADLVHAGAIGFSALAILMGTGLFMCNAGDVTVGASNLCTAMYSSGWENCQGQTAVRVRKVIMISMVYAQRPVLIKGLGIMDLSYQSYVSLVKSTYSVFSLICQQAA